MSYATWLGGPKAGRVDDIPNHIQQVAYTDLDAGEAICPVISNEAGRWIIWDGEQYGIWTPVYSADLADEHNIRRSLEAVMASRLVLLDCYTPTIQHHWEDRLIETPRWALASSGWRTRIRP